MREKTKRLREYEKATSREVVFGTKEINELRGALIKRLKRDITWKELAELSGVSSRAVAAVKAGYNAYPMVVQKLIKFARENGVMVHLSDYVKK